MYTLVVYLFYFWILREYFNLFLTARDLTLIRRTAIWGLFFTVQLAGLSQIRRLLLLYMFNCLAITALCRLLYCGSMKKIVYLSLSGCTVGMLAELCVAFAFQIWGYSAEETSFTGIVLSRLLLLSLVHAMSIYRHQRSYESPALFSWVLLLISTLSSIAVTHILFYLSQTENSVFLQKLAFGATVLLLIMNITFYVLYQKLSDAAEMQIENLMMSRQLKRYEELRADRSTQIRDFRREKHNLKNQLLAIRSYAQQNKNSEIIAFVNALISEPDFGLTSIYICDNIVLDTLLHSKTNFAQSHNIEYTWDIAVPAALPFGDADLCVLIGNALDNAFDACQQAGKDERMVRVMIHFKHDCLYCHFQNSYSHRLVRSDSSLFSSTKSDSLGHGHGLPSIRRIVDKYNGHLVINYSDNIFSLKAILYSK